VKLRRLLFLAAAIITAALPSIASAKEADVTIVRVFTGWRDAASFKRISEYFDNRENTGGETIVRTHPDQRAGFYFLARVGNPGAARAVKITVQLITPVDAKPKPYTFTADLKSGTTVLDLGLTGSDWPDAKANPVAWKMDILSADGATLATEKSYLWEKPAAK
jgi:hypothetical protein